MTYNLIHNKKLILDFILLFNVILSSSKSDRTITIQIVHALKYRKFSRR